MEKVKNLMKRSETVAIFEHHNGLMVNGKLMEDFDNSLEEIFRILPHTNIKSFSYTSSWVVPNFSCFTGVPRSLTIIELSNWRGVSDVVIEQLMSQGVECHTPYDVPFDNLNLVDYSDSGKFKRIDGYWVRHASMVGEEIEGVGIILGETRKSFLVDAKGVEKYVPKDSIQHKRVPDGYLYAVKDSCWKNKFKIGHTKKTEEVRKYLMTRYQTSFGKGNVVIVKLVPVFGDVRKAEQKMLKRFAYRKGEVVSGSENFVKSKVF